MNIKKPELKIKNKALKTVKIRIFTIRIDKPLCSGFILNLMEKHQNRGNQPCGNIYIKDNIFIGGRTLHYFEMEENPYGFYRLSIHIASMRYKNIKDILKNELAIRELRKCVGSSFSVEFGNSEVSWVKWQRAPSLSLIEYFSKKGRPLKFSA